MKTFSFYWHSELEAEIKRTCAKLKKPYTMSLTSKSEIEAVVRAVNQGIDSHLEACNSPERGDSYEHGERSITATEDSANWKKGDKLVLAITLECRVSPESLPVLIRRLMEDETEVPSGEDGQLLASTILDTLGIEVI